MSDMDYIDIRINFSRKVEDDEVYFNPISAEFLESSILSDYADDIAEAAFQSDLYTVGLTNAVLSSLDGGKHSISY